MSTMWALIEVCFADARKAEELLADLSARRELRLDPETALAGFVLWKRVAARNERSETTRADRKRIGAHARRAKAQSAA